MVAGGIFVLLLVFLRGVLENGVCSGWFFVVKCVVDVVREMAVFG